MMAEFYRHYLICKYNFAYSLFSTTCELTNDKRSFKFLGKFLLFDSFKDLHFSWLIEDYTDKGFWKVILFFSYKLLKSLQ